MEDRAGRTRDEATGRGLGQQSAQDLVGPGTLSAFAAAIHIVLEGHEGVEAEPKIHHALGEVPWFGLCPDAGFPGSGGCLRPEDIDGEAGRSSLSFAHCGGALVAISLGKRAEADHGEGYDQLAAKGRTILKGTCV